jgi:hypothetical protein
VRRRPGLALAALEGKLGNKAYRGVGAGREVGGGARLLGGLGNGRPGHRSSALPRPGGRWPIGHSPDEGTRTPREDGPRPRRATRYDLDTPVNGRVHPREQRADPIDAHIEVVNRGVDLAPSGGVRPRVCELFGGHQTIIFSGEAVPIDELQQLLDSPRKAVEPEALSAVAPKLSDRLQPLLVIHTLADYRQPLRSRA